MPSSAGNSRLSHPEICSGDHWSASFCATRHRSSGQLARRQGFGRSALSQASESASLARYALRPPCRLTSRVTVEGARPSLAAILRIESTRGNPARNLLTLLQLQCDRRSPACRWGNSSIQRQDPVDAALVPPLERSRNVGYTLTVPPAVPNLSPLLRRKPRPCVPLHTHTSSSGKIRRCCVDRLNPPPKADVTTINVSMLCRCGTVGPLYEPYPSRGRWISNQFSRTPATLTLFISRSARLRAPRTCRRRRPLSR